MREIKFRQFVWNEDDGQSAGVLLSWEELLQEKDESVSVIFKNTFSNASPLMQYTGLTDKNGRKIYERDVLKRRVHVVMYGTDLNEWVDEIVEVEWREDYAGFFVGERPLYAEVGATIDRSTLCSCTQFEIIGNVFENPELLEVNEK